MRRKKSSSGLTQVCSDSNGKVKYDFHTSEELLTGVPHSLRYKVSKPYFCATVNRHQEPKESVNMFTRTVPAWEDIVSNFIGDSTTFEKSLFSNAIDLDYAVNGALENSQAYGNILLYVTAVEAKQTVRMIRNVFVRLFNIILDIYKSVKKLNVVATLDIITDVWLEYRYGWRPLIGEIKAVRDALTVVNPKGIKSSYGLHKQKKALDPHIPTKTKTMQVGKSLIEIEHQAFFVGECTAKCGFNYVNKVDSRNDSWAAVFGLDWQSLASTAWELVPFSFIIDMFLNIGGMLQTQNIEDEVDFFNGYTSCRGNIELKSTVKRITEPAGFILPIDILTLDERNLYYQDDSIFKKTLDRLTAIFKANYLDRNLFYQKGHNDGGSFISQHQTLEEAEAYIKSRPGWQEHWDLETSLGFMGIDDILYASSKKFGRYTYDSVHVRNNAWFYQLFPEFIGPHYKYEPVIWGGEPENEWDVRTPYRYGALVFTSSREQLVPDVSVDDVCNWCRNIMSRFSAACNRPEFRLKREFIRETRYGKSYKYTWAIGRTFSNATLEKSTEPDLEPYRSNFDLFQRFDQEEFSYSFTADMDLSDAQTADLMAFAYKLGRYFSKLK